MITFCMIVLNAMAATNQYIIHGETVTQLNGKKVMLFKFRHERVSHVDTTEVIDGKFSFSGKVDTARFAEITCGNYPDTVRSAKLMLEPGTITVFLDRHSVIGGTPLNTIYQPFLAQYAIVNDSLEAEGNKKGLVTTAM